MPYTGDPQNRPSDAVRLLVGDVSTSTGSEYMADADYGFFVAQTPDLYSAAALAATAIGMKLTGSGSRKQVGDLMLERTPSDFSALAKRFDRMSALQTAPSAGGLVRPDGSTVAPFFRRNQFDNPGTDPTSTLLGST